MIFRTNIARSIDAAIDAPDTAHDLDEATRNAIQLLTADARNLEHTPHHGAHTMRERVLGMINSN